MQAIFEATPRNKRRHRRYCPALFITLLMAMLALWPGASPGGDIDPAGRDGAASGCPSCRSFDRLNTLVRDGKIEINAAREEVSRLLTAIGEEYRTTAGGMVTSSAWVFPLKGYDVSAVGKGRGHGYLPRGYDYFDGNQHGGHPALDIFIRDRNRDDRDDRTGHPVAVVAITGGIVVARETEWAPGSRLRGGKYVWVYDPASALLFYYAHLAEVRVEVGAVVAAGEVLGSVGRTGLNASKTRSPTHLHLMALATGQASLPPVDLYPRLAAARRQE